MEPYKEDAAKLTKLHNSTVSRTNQLKLEIDLLIMQSEALRDLALKMGDYIGKANISDTNFSYWANKMDEYWAKAAGFSSLRDLRIRELEANTQKLVDEAKKYGIEVDFDSTGTSNEAQEE